MEENKRSLVGRITDERSVIRRMSLHAAEGATLFRPTPYTTMNVVRITEGRE